MPEVFADKKSGKDTEWAELWECLEYMRASDTLVVPSLDRLGRSLQDLIAIVAGLRMRDIGFRSLHDVIDTTTPGGRLVFHVFAALAGFIRELIVQGTIEGFAAARARGQRLGRHQRPRNRSGTPAQFSPGPRRSCPRWRDCSASRGRQSTNTSPSSA
ncbi:recombinase family protein [Nocardia fluminea]|uniref:recombinase family protein n=1 Tax=Nocardia fluminea TaxID=134984 RepID=UPI001B808C85|nr:recombinase family protein [Nocardia fluminea]